MYVVQFQQQGPQGSETCELQGELLEDENLWPGRPLVFVLSSHRRGNVWQWQLYDYPSGLLLATRYDAKTRALQRCLAMIEETIEARREIVNGYSAEKALRFWLEEQQAKGYNLELNPPLSDE